MATRDTAADDDGMRIPEAVASKFEDANNSTSIIGTINTGSVMVVEVQKYMKKVPISIFDKDDTSEADDLSPPFVLLAVLVVLEFLVAAALWIPAPPRRPSIGSADAAFAVGRCETLATL